MTLLRDVTTASVAEQAAAGRPTFGGFMSTYSSVLDPTPVAAAVLHRIGIDLRTGCISTNSPVVTLDALADEVHRAVRDLQGSISLEALPEMVWRLVQARLPAKSKLLAS